MGGGEPPRRRGGPARAAGRHRRHGQARVPRLRRGQVHRRLPALQQGAAPHPGRDAGPSHHRRGRLVRPLVRPRRLERRVAHRAGAHAHRARAAQDAELVPLAPVVRHGHRERCGRQGRNARAAASQVAPGAACQDLL